MSNLPNTRCFPHALLVVFFPLYFILDSGKWFRFLLLYVVVPLLAT
jgi:hypothetical protein